MVDSVDAADFVVVNTCGYIDSARDESYGAIDEMLDLKRRGKLRSVVVTGCLAERQQGKLLESRPEIDALVGVFGRNEIVSVVDRLQSGIDEQQKLFRPAAIRPLSGAPSNGRNSHVLVSTCTIVNEPSGFWVISWKNPGRDHVPSP